MKKFCACCVTKSDLLGDTEILIIIVGKGYKYDKDVKRVHKTMVYQRTPIKKRLFFPYLSWMLFNVYGFD
jgi:hypothetical protein